MIREPLLRCWFRFLLSLSRRTARRGSIRRVFRQLPILVTRSGPGAIEPPAYPPRSEVPFTVKELGQAMILSETLQWFQIYMLNGNIQTTTNYSKKLQCSQWKITVFTNISKLFEGALWSEKPEHYTPVPSKQGINSPQADSSSCTKPSSMPLAKR